MFNLRIVQADYGDCLILEFEDNGEPRFILVDGGPKDVYDRHLRGELSRIADDGGALEAMIVSHVDKDHIVGLLDFSAELQEDQANGDDPLIEVGQLWLNSFARTIGHDNDVQARLEALQNSVAGSSQLASTDSVLFGISEGNSLRVRALQLGIPLNPGFPNELVCVDDHPDPVEIGNLTLRIVGPTTANLEELRTEWQDWLDEHEDGILAFDPDLMGNADKSIPNLSSIMVLAEADGRSVLLTGDGRSDHLLDGLEEAGLLDADGKLHVDVLKVMHHGSDRNATRTFFRNVTADTYVISANYHPDNPDLSTLIWIVEAAEEQDREIRLIATNPVNTLFKLRDEYPEDEYGYTLEIMPDHHHFRRLELA